MTSDEETNNRKSGSERKEKRLKKIASPPKSPKSSKKSKKSHFIIKKLKLKSKSVSESSPRASAAEGDLVLVKSSESSSVLERQTPEGDDNFILTKSASETNLKETWRSGQNLADDTEKVVAESAGTSETDQAAQQKVFPERTKSLENLKDMLTYGELILDKTAESVKQCFDLFSIFTTLDCLFI